MIDSTTPVRVAGKVQTIAFPAIAEHTVGETDFDPGVSASSGLAVTLASTTPSTCTVVGGRVHIVAPGQCTITAEQEGDVEWAAAPTVQRSFTVARKSQTLTFPQPAEQTFFQPDFELEGTATSGLPVTFTSLTAPVCLVAGSTLHMIAPGTCEVEAEQPGSAEYAPAVPVTRSFTIARAPQSVSFPPIGTHTVGDPDFDPGVSASSGLAVTLASTTPSTCTIVGGRVHFLTAGACTITADQGGDVDWAPAPTVQRTFTVARGSQTLTFPQPAERTFFQPDFELEATATSGLPVDYNPLTASVCLVAGSTLHMIAPGTCEVEARQPGNAAYEPALPVTRSFTIGRRVCCFPRSLNTPSATPTSTPAPPPPRASPSPMSRRPR
jgi:hypothetical protein